MKFSLKYSPVALALAFGLTLCSHAVQPVGEPRPVAPVREHVRSVSDVETAPEVDPGMAISALTLLGGTLVAFRARRRG